LKSLKKPSDSTGFAGSAGIPAETEESSAEMASSVTRHISPLQTVILQEPPIANREVEITIPPENRSLLDWVSFTFKLNDPYEVAGKIGIDSELFSLFPFGFSGYRKSLRFGNISIFFDGRDDMGCHVEMSGQGCRQYEGHFSESPWQELLQTVVSENGKFTRLDLAIDNVDGVLTLERIWAAIQDHEKYIRTQFGEWRRIQKGSFHKGEMITGDTIYLGSSKSHVMFRVYDKAQETKIAGHWIRFEIQLRDKRAHEAAKLFASGMPVGSMATRSISPLPQMPHGSPSPITPISSVPAGVNETRSIAPEAARMPQEMFIPSKAGPAAVADAVSTPSTASANSPLVPMSMNSETPESLVRSTASIPTLMSAPT
jgi:phage replication initiation protein